MCSYACKHSTEPCCNFKTMLSRPCCPYSRLSSNIMIAAAVESRAAGGLVDDWILHGRLALIYCGCCIASAASCIARSRWSTWLCSIPTPTPLGSTRRTTIYSLARTQTVVQISRMRSNCTDRSLPRYRYPKTLPWSRRLITVGFMIQYLIHFNNRRRLRRAPVTTHWRTSLMRI